MTTTADVLVVGAGPAGLSAAIAAARCGDTVVLLEKMSRAGLKLLLTGGGRANIAGPGCEIKDLIGSYGRDGRALRQALSAFNFADFLKSILVDIERDADGVTAPAYIRGGAKQFVKALLSEAERLGITIRYSSPVVDASASPDGGYVVQTTDGDWRCERLILATGGMTYPQTGSTGDGFRLAGQLGCPVITPRPALGGFSTLPAFPELAGISISDVSASVSGIGRIAIRRRGPLLFTHRGVSGPMILNLSVELARLTDSADALTGVPIVFDLSPDQTTEGIVDEGLARAKRSPRRSLSSGAWINGLSARVLSAIIALSGVDGSRPLAQVSKLDFRAVAQRAKSLTFTIREPLDVAASMVTAGGVDIRALDPRTMECVESKGLHMTGELLSPAGDCGGYNLLLAFATGDAAGRNRRTPK
ncbi:MAG: aminoacetone oxidase family FAD-binding enzyme [Planctomycetota bacterium]